MSEERTRRTAGVGLPLRGVHISRRRLLQISAALPAAVAAACGLDQPSPSGTPGRLVTGGPTEDATTPWASSTATATPTATPSPTPSPTAAPVTAGRVLYREAALTDARSPTLQVAVSVLVEDGVIRWIRPTDGEEDSTGAEVIDAAGATIVPGMVDAHSHVTLPGGARWLERRFDAPERLLAYAEANGELALRAGVRWLRDVGSPVLVDPADGRSRALSLGVKDRWAGRRDRPYLRAAGTWLTRAGQLPAGLAGEVANADQLVAAALIQLDDGADLVKLYLDGSDPAVPPWSADEVARVVDAVHARGARVTAHAGWNSACRVAAAGGVDAIEHGWEIDADVAATMASRGTRLVSTLSVFRSWLTFAATSRIADFTAAERQARYAERLEGGAVAMRIARDAGVAIAAGTDFGGGSLRANQLAWEVESLVAAGFEPWEALAAATWRGGELLGEPDAGLIREGGPADFFLVHGDPLSDPAALWRVWRVAS